MWIILAFGSAFFAGVTAILSKYGIRRTDSNLATAIRTLVVLFFSWVMVFLVGSQNTLSAVGTRSFVFLVLSGLSTGASWLCYFRALQLGDVNKVTPIDKSSVILTMVLAAVFLGEGITWLKLLSMAGIGAGTLMMIQHKATDPAKKEDRSWVLFACLSAVFASLTSILGKVGIEGVESNLGTAIRTLVVLILAWGIVFGQKKQRQIASIDGRSWCFLILSGFATGASWLCYYRALQEGLASVVVPIDKLSILFTVLFSRIFLGERLSARGLWGLFLITAGTLLLLV